MAMCADGLAKLLEEMGELAQVCAKKLAYFDTDEHPDGSSLKQRMESEMGDVLAAINFVIFQFKLDGHEIRARSTEKLHLFNKWHAQTDNDQGFLSKQAGEA